MERISRTVRRALLAVAGNEALFLLTAFVVSGVLNMSPLLWYQEAVDLAHRYVVVPWGMALCLLRLTKNPQGARRDVAILFVLLMWIVVPFALRFGLTFNNATSWQGSATVFFGVYALASERDAQTRAGRLDLACALFAALGLALGGALLWCAWTVRMWGAELGEFGFGVAQGMYLCHGVHYNHTGMVALCCAMMALAGAGRAKKPLPRAIYAVSAGAMAVVIVLTQSRTARYALIAALAAGAYGVALRGLRGRGIAVRQIAAVAAALAVAALGYAGAKALSDAALAHYARAYQAEAAEQPPDGAEAAQDASAEPAPQVEARAAVDATLSGRTGVWKNLIDYWKRNPKYMLIGNGTGRTGSLVVQGTIHEASGAVMIHNAYLQYIADYGLIGFALLMAFAASIAPAVVRAFLGGKPGMTAMGMIAVAALLTGLMESQPLGAMTPINAVLFFALAMLRAEGDAARPVSP